MCDWYRVVAFKTAIQKVYVPSFIAPPLRPHYRSAKLFSESWCTGVVVAHGQLAQRDGVNRRDDAVDEHDPQPELRRRLRRGEHRSMVKAAPWQCSSSAAGRAWWPWAAQHSQGETQPLGAQLLPRLLGLAATKAADVTTFDHPGSSTTTPASTTRGRRLLSRSTRRSTGLRPNWR